MEPLRLTKDLLAEFDEMFYEKIQTPSVTAVFPYKMTEEEKNKKQLQIVCYEEQKLRYSVDDEQERSFDLVKKIIKRTCEVAYSKEGQNTHVFREIEKACVVTKQMTATEIRECIIFISVNERKNRNATMYEESQLFLKIKNEFVTTRNTIVELEKNKAIKQVVDDVADVADYLPDVNENYIVNLGMQSDELREHLTTKMAFCAMEHVFLKKCEKCGDKIKNDVVLECKCGEHKCGICRKHIEPFERFDHIGDCKLKENIENDDDIKMFIMTNEVNDLFDFIMSKKTKHKVKVVECVAKFSEKRRVLIKKLAKEKYHDMFENI